jgi:dolichol kinase
MISLGGALGGLLVGLAAPSLLPGYFEMAIGLSRARCCASPAASASPGGPHWPRWLWSV